MSTDKVVTGTDASETQNGGAGNDTLAGSLGSDTLTGNGGADTFEFVAQHFTDIDVVTDFDPENDLLDLSAFSYLATLDSVLNLAMQDGDDVVINLRGLAGGQVRLQNVQLSSLTSANLLLSAPLNLTGTAEAETLYGTGGNDTIDGDGGDDDIRGGEGADILRGGSGDDIIDGDAGDDNISGGEGADTLSGGAGNDTIEGGEGDDELSGNNGTDSIEGGSGNDSIEGGGGNDTLHGGGGDDTLDAGAGSDLIHGDAGNDSLVGGAGSDTLYGGEGNDTLIGGAGDDSLVGGSGSDSFWTSTGDDTLSGGEGSDSYEVRGLTSGGSGNHTITDFSVDEDRIDLSGIPGVEMLEDFAITDAPDGTGVTIDLTGVGVGVSMGTLFLEGVSAADLDESSFVFGEGQTWTGTGGADVKYGSSFGDTFRGEGGDDSIYGFYGRDNLDGGAGNDTLNGGAGDDELTGGSGADTFVFHARHGNDTIVDFSDADGDVIDLTAFTGISDFSDLAITRDGTYNVIDLTSFDGGRIRIGNEGAEMEEDDFLFSQGEPGAGAQVDDGI